MELVLQARPSLELLVKKLKQEYQLSVLPLQPPLQEVMHNKFYG